jgi:hypothetical protein
MTQAMKDYRARLKAKGYVKVEVYVPARIAEEVRDTIRQMIAEEESNAG